MTLKWSSQYAPVDGDFSNVSILLLGEGANGSTTITDSSGSPKTVTAVGNAQISTAVNTPFGTGDGVLTFDGNGDYIESPESSAFAYGTGDFTIEMWLYPASGMSIFSTFYNNLLSAGNNTGFYLWTQPAGAGFYSIDLLPSDAAYIVNSDGDDIQANTWSHFALTRSGTTIRGFVNGTQIWTATSSLNITANKIRLANPLGNTSGQDWNGYISNLRITKGVARYTENFDVPTAPFPIYSPTTRAQV